MVIQLIYDSFLARLTFKPCETCFGILRDIQLVATDMPANSLIKSLSVVINITIDVQPVNNAPVIVVLDKDSNIIQHPDPTDDIMVI